MDKAIRSAKLTAAGILDKARARTAVNRAGGQIAPSKYLPDVPRAVHAGGGKVAFQQGNHPDVPNVVYHGTNRDIQSFDPNAQRNYDIDPRKPDSTDTGWFGKGHYFTPRAKAADHYANEAARRHSRNEGAQVYPVHLSMKNPFVVNMKDTDSGATTLDKALNAAGVPMHPRGYRMPSEQTAALIAMGHDGVIAKREGKTEEIVAFHPHQIKSAIGNQGTFDPNDPDITKAGGGRIHANGGGVMDLRSKAAQVIRNQPQEKGNVDQMLAMMAARGVKPSELLNAGRPFGHSVSKEELAQHFENAMPDVQITKYVAKPLSDDEKKEFHDLSLKNERTWGEARRFFDLREKINRNTHYPEYSLPGGENYREHLLHLPLQEGPIAKRKKELQDRWQKAYESQAPKEELDRIGREFDSLPDMDENANFKSSHWNTPNVLAHLRMDEHDNGKTLHIQEIQSDWGQEGREKGLHDPANPFEVINKKTKEVVSRHPDYRSMTDAFKAHPDSANLIYGDVGDEKPPQGPYVGNTQHWTDLAVKHALTEAAKGGHDRVVFSPGEANADMYGQRKEVGTLKFLKSKDSGEAGILSAYSKDGRRSSQHEIESHSDLSKLIGKENAANLLAQAPTLQPDEGEDRYAHTLQGPLTVGGHGMVDYYNNIVHPAALKLLRQHDPSIQPESYDLPNGYKGFALPMTETARQSIIKNGFQAFKDGGTVDDNENPAPVIQNPMSVFPKPQRMFPEDQRPKGGQYISAHDKADVTGHKAETATIGVHPGGKPFFHASQNAVDQTGTVGKGSATTKTNLFKQKAGWKWQDTPEGHEKTDTIVSVEHRGKHFYALNTHFPKGVDLARYENATSEPRLRPTTQGNVTLGPQAGSIVVRGKMHPVYHHVIVKAAGGTVDDALALTRRFTKDGNGATLALKPKGK